MPGVSTLLSTPPTLGLEQTATFRSVADGGIGEHNPEVISIDRIWRGCTLIPQFGSTSVPVSWTRGDLDVLDLASKYYLGRHLDPQFFDEYEQERKQRRV